MSDSYYHLPEISTYYDRADGRNTTRIDIGPVTMWYSYKTLVAFWVSGFDRVVRQNDWSVTTGKHLNCIDGGSKAAKARRVSAEEFKARWNLLAAPLLASAAHAAERKRISKGYLNTRRKLINRDYLKAADAAA